MSENDINKAAVKHDADKPRHELIPTDALDALALVLTFGAKKYKAWNWAKGFEWGRVYGAMQRHLTAWVSGEDKDPESGLSHLAHAMFGVAVLIVHEKRGLGTDDRHKWPVVDEAKAAEQVQTATRITSDMTGLNPLPSGYVVVTDSFGKRMLLPIESAVKCLNCHLPAGKEPFYFVTRYGCTHGMPHVWAK